MTSSTFLPGHGPSPTSFAVVALVMALTTSLLSSSASATGTGAGAIADRLAQGQQALSAWQLDAAAAIAQELDATVPDIPPVQALLGAVRFHQGDYESAVRLLRRAAEGGAVPALLPLAESTLEETKGFVSVETPHFVIRVPKGKDEVLIPIATQALEQAWDRITTAFDFKPNHRIAVDVLHDAKGLASVSSLTVSEIETSGTIALCKYNRLMITSPKALARGYSWLDTLSHELLHLIISEKSHNNVPVWLHEGLAKYNETRWRGPPGLALDPSSENLLAKGVKAKKLITFEQMHPSMAKLPSQEDTALAFAEVFSVIEFIERTVPDKAGKRATNVLIEGLRDDLTMDQSLKAATGRDLDGLQKDWMAYLRKRPFKLVPGAEPQKLTFVKNARGAGASLDETEDEAALIEATKAGKEGRRFVRLGNLLRERRRLKAAAIEYEKATTITGVQSPALHNRLAGVLLEVGDVAKAADVLQRTEAVFPEDPQTQVLLGRVALRAEKWAEARGHYEHATWENPFIPEVYMALYTVGEKTGDAALKTRAQHALGILMGHSQTQVGSPLYLKDGVERGTLSLRTSPWGRLFVDGVDTGATTPVTDLPLAVGKHAIRVEDTVSGRADGVIVEIKSGQSESLNLTLRELTEGQRQSLFAAEAALHPPPPARKKPVAAHDVDDRDVVEEIIPPWVEDEPVLMPPPGGLLPIEPRESIP